MALVAFSDYAFSDYAFSDYIQPKDITLQKLEYEFHTLEV